MKPDITFERPSVQSLGRVAVLMGGVSAERAVSLRSGQAVAAALKSIGVNAEAVDVQTVEEVLAVTRDFDRAFVALHGRWGEDGGVQAILDAQGFPYTGSGMAASALAMDKVRTKRVWQGMGLPTPAFQSLGPSQSLSTVTLPQTFPLIIKPSHEGSSIGMQKVDTADTLDQAVADAQALDSEILIEQWVTGREFTAAVVGTTVLPLIELKTDHAFYDYDAKYASNTTQYICPVDLSPGLVKTLSELVYQAFEAVGARHWGRVDFMLDERLNPWLIEVNTAPGMTDHSLVPMAAKEAGLTFPDLVCHLLGMTLPTASEAPA
ncbi:D-alanine--D-alanine ligase [Thiomicrospira sp. WB1]|uniref:D-alanine--D-alanine ligase n=1 Tax=Thiomicrospira sp. WB1 TaxID=1685380 RepID=UPI000749718F|nr:D-alanine--D-alanine ligase [Thiomicrospira sp. WB1]KUJ71403.1 D-alanine--D-alanine ligase [Thiomicrospira sp. WB1]